MRGSLESALKVYDEGMIDRLEDLLLRLHVLNLLQTDYLTLLKTFECQRLGFGRLALMLY